LAKYEEGKKPDPQLKEVVIGKQEFIIKNPEVGGKYYIQVSAVSEMGEGYRSNI